MVKKLKFKDNKPRKKGVRKTSYSIPASASAKVKKAARNIAKRLKDQIDEEEE